MKRVLIIDDDLGGAEALATLLGLDGYEVVALGSSSKALELLADDDFHAVITDLEMPQVHGLDVVRAVRARSASTPVLVATGYSTSAAARSAIDLGANAVFAKPIEYDHLTAELARLLDNA